MSNVEDLLKQLSANKVMAWVVVEPNFQSWTAGYQVVINGRLNEWYFDGATAQEALEKLIEHIETYKLVAGLFR